MLSPLNSRLPRRNESWLSVWPGVCQTSSFKLADANPVAFVDQRVELDRRHFQVNVLRRDLGERLDLVARGQRLGRQRMAGDLGLEQPA